MTDIINKADVDAAVWDFHMEDNPFLPREYIEAISKEYDGFLFDRYVLGRWTAPEGAIYRRFIADRDKFLIRDFAAFENGFETNEINIGVDFGGSRSGHAFVACAIGRRVGAGLPVIVALASERHLRDDIDPVELYGLIAAFVEKVRKKYGRVDNVYCDGAEPVLIRGLRTASGAGDAAVRAVKKRRIIDRIRATLALMAGERFYLTEDCATLGNALAEAVWSERDNARLDDGTSDIDTLDAFEYAWMRELERVTESDERRGALR